MGAHDGHRERMFSRLEKEELSDCELLEILLFPLLPRRNTSDLAHRLLGRFGDIAGVYTAEIADLKTVDGVGDTLAANIYATGEVFRRHFYNRKVSFERKLNSGVFLPFAKEEYEGLDVEVLDLYFLGEHAVTLEKFRYSDLDDFCVRMPPAKLAKSLAEHQPSPRGLFLVHNHPGVFARPSDADDRMTCLCEVVCSLHGVIFCDHIIYGSDESSYSYYQSGRMKKIAKEYSIKAIMEGVGSLTK